jgi:hypothetical protein
MSEGRGERWTRAARPPYGECLARKERAFMISQCRRAISVGLLTSLMLVIALACAPLAGAEGRCGSYSWCDTSRSAEARAGIMLAAMTQSDKVGILTGQAASDVGLPAIKFTDGGVGAGGTGSGLHGATAMPAGMALAANFDPAMAVSYGTVVGAEVKHRGFDGDYGPTVNIMRTPLGGRTFEAYGEDPFLAAQTAVGWIDGFQTQGVMADVKHYAVNNQEGQVGVSPVFGVYGGRTFVNVHVDARTLHGSSSPPSRRLSPRRIARPRCARTTSSTERMRARILFCSGKRCAACGASTASWSRTSSPVMRPLKISTRV